MQLVPHRIRNTLKEYLLDLGHYARALRQDEFPGVAVLAYHGIRAGNWPPGTVPFEELHVPGSEFDAQCQLIQETCHPISLAQWRAARTGGPPLPARPVLLTFDDGYRTVRTHGLPILQRYGIPAVVFVCSDPVAERRMFWWDAVARSHGETEALRLKAMPYDEWLPLCANVHGFIDSADPSAPLTIEDLRTLVDSPLIEVGSHTASHAILAQAGMSQQRSEIFRNKTHLEAWTGRSVTAFAYPNGRRGLDYTSETVQLVEQYGFDFAFTSEPGFATSEESPLEQRRFLMLAGTSAAELAHRLTYSWRA